MKIDSIESYPFSTDQESFVFNFIASIFLCSMANGVIQAYYAKHAREAYKKMPSFPRTNEVIRTVQLLEKTAVTLDGSKR